MKAWAVAGNADKAIVQAKMDAVDAALFHGIPYDEPTHGMGLSNLNPLVTPAEYEAHKVIFNNDMDAAIGVMGDIMAEMDYDMFSLKQELKQIHTEDAYGMAVTSKSDGIVQESYRYLITRNVGADFIVELSIENKPFGDRKAVEFKAQTIDAASKKILQGNAGTSSASSAPTPVLVKEAVGGFIDTFCHKINIPFTDIETNGREGSITFKIADDCPLNFERDVTVDGEHGELADYITYWLA